MIYGTPSILNKKSSKYKTFSKRKIYKALVYPTSHQDIGRPKGARSVSPVLKSKILDLLQAGKFSRKFLLDSCFNALVVSTGSRFISIRNSPGLTSKY